MENSEALEKTLKNLRTELLSLRTPAGYWVGELSSSALSTATALSALALAGRTTHENHIRRGLQWLARNCNADGGWGDTVLSKSNISTTALCWSAFALAGTLAEAYADVVGRARLWLEQSAGGLESGRLAPALYERYGKDRTFAVPILVNCALAGRLGDGREAWRQVIPLPYELAAFPQRWYKWLRLPVVSYALPALIAVGLVQHRHNPASNPLRRLLRQWTAPRTLKILQSIQPSSGGFLEAVPLTSFVVMSLAASGCPEHPVTQRGVAFLLASIRPDGSWPIDSNLSTWLTTLAVNALAANSGLSLHLTEAERSRLANWLLAQQYRQEHPYTLAEPGGWAWTDLPGGVPDADDTAGALLALRHLAPKDARVVHAAAAGVNWLLSLQNRDGGVPTFCKGWGNLPFDRSSPDITAHALRALAAWLDDLPPVIMRKTRGFIRRGIDYLVRAQGTDGSWVPLWFGNQHVDGDANPTYGTARVLKALQEISTWLDREHASALMAGVEWLISAQNPDGGWGGGPSSPSSIEETALALEALSNDSQLLVVSKGAGWLIAETLEGKRVHSSPIGLYFARLWYFERLYPLIFSVAALERLKGSKFEVRGSRFV